MAFKIVSGAALTPLKSDGFRTGLRNLLLGKCHPCAIPNASRIIVKQMDFDEYIKMYFSKHIEYFAHDPEKVCKSGDVVLIEELDKRMTRDITHKVLKVIYPLGDVTDPISGKKCCGIHFREDMEKIDELWGKNKNAFDYEKAPPRGWQEGKKDWTHKKGYRKIHEFSDRDQSEATID